MEIIILGSQCQTMDYYLQHVEKVANEFNIEYSIDKIMDYNKIHEYGVDLGCLMGYCPGCNFLEREKGIRYTPALVINGKVKLHSCFPSKEQIEEVLNNLLQQTSHPHSSNE